MTTEEISNFLEKVTPEDFDGHTEFDRLTAEQRLMWLSQIAQFVVLYKGAANRKPDALPQPSQTDHSAAKSDAASE